MLRVLIRNIVSNWVGFSVQVAVAFFLTPFILHSLGDTRYGIWSLVIGLTGYYGLLDPPGSAPALRSTSRGILRRATSSR